MNQERLFDRSVRTFDRFGVKQNNLNDPHPLHPILTSLSVLGIRIDYGSPTGKIKKVFFGVYTAIAVIYYHYCAMTDVIWYFQNSIEEEVLADSVTVWCAVCTVDFLLLKRKDFAKVLITVASETSKFSEKDQNRFRKIVKVACCIVWLFVVTYNTQYMILKREEDFPKYRTDTLLHKYYDSFPLEQKLIVIKIDRSAECIFVQGSLTMIMSLYVLLCYNAKLWFRRFNSDYQYPESAKNRFRELNDIREFRAAFEELSKCVELLDDVFSQTVALWLLAILINLCVRILGIFNPYSLTTTEMLLAASLAFLRAAVVLVAMSFVADSVQQEAVKSLGRLNNLIRNENAILNSTMYHEVQLAVFKYTFYPTQLTVWKFASLNRSFLMTCLGMMTTYVIICIQLNPTAMREING